MRNGEKLTSPLQGREDNVFTSRSTTCFRYIFSVVLDISAFKKCKYIYVRYVYVNSPFYSVLVRYFSVINSFCSVLVR
jgi:hypothetical protein